jgi:hypothetical protein
MTPSKDFSTTRQEASNAHHHSVQTPYSPSGAKMTSKNMMNHYRLITARFAPNTLKNKVNPRCSEPSGHLPLKYYPLRLT